MKINSRIEYIDALRGFVMLLVVLGHVPMYCYHQADAISFSLIPTTFHLALFFFISGWFIKNVSVSDNVAHNYRSIIEGKFVQLIIPTIVFYLLYCWMNGIDIVENLWSDKFKAGYWFCIVLFVFWLTLAITKPITEKLGGTFDVLLGIGDDYAQHQFGDGYAGKIQHPKRALHPAVAVFYFLLSGLSGKAI